MAEGEKPKIEVASANMSGSDLKKRAKELKVADDRKPSAPSVSEEVKRGMEEATAPLVKAIENLVPVAGVDALADVVEAAADLKDTLIKKEPEKLKEKRKVKEEEQNLPSYKGRPLSQIRTELEAAYQGNADPNSEQVVKLLQEKAQVVEAASRDGFLQPLNDVRERIDGISVADPNNPAEVQQRWGEIKAEISGMNPSSLEKAGIVSVSEDEDVQKESADTYRGLINLAEDTLSREAQIYDERALGQDTTEVQRKQFFLGVPELVPANLRDVGRMRVGLNREALQDQERKALEDALQAARTGGPQNPYLGNGMYGFEFRARSIGFPEEDMEMLKKASEAEAVKWLKGKIWLTEDVSDMLAREIYSHINFGLDYIRDENAGKRELYNKMFEVLNDRLLLSKFFSAFSAAGKEDFGKAAKELTRMSRDVFGGRSGAERLTRLWRESFPTMAAMEDRSKTIEVERRNEKGEIVKLQVPRLQAYLDSSGTEMDSQILKGIESDLKIDISEVSFGIRMWRSMGRQALFDAYIPSISTDPNDKKWNGIRRMDSEDKKLAQLMAFDLWAAKYHLGGNKYLWEVGDIEYRDFISFWFPDSELEKLGLKRDKAFIVSNLSSGKKEALEKLDFTKIDKDGSLYADWLGSAEHAGNTVEALTAWMVKPNAETLAGVKSKFLHLFTNPWGRLKVGDPYPAPEYDKGVTEDQVKMLGARKWLKFYQIANRTLQLRTGKYQSNPNMIIRDKDVYRDFAEDLVLSPTSSGQDREMELWMLEQMGASKTGSDASKGWKLVKSGVIAFTKSLFGIK